MVLFINVLFLESFGLISIEVSKNQINPLLRDSVIKA